LLYGGNMPLTTIQNKKTTLEGGNIGFRPFLRNDPLNASLLPLYRHLRGETSPLNASLLPPLLNKCLYFPMLQVKSTTSTFIKLVLPAIPKGIPAATTILSPF